MKIERSMFLTLLLLCLFSLTAWAQQSTTGPTPPPGMDFGHQNATKAQVVLSDVPAYIWHHGCGPTAVGMVIGYWDANGCPNMVPGDASTQTNAVENMIADDDQNPSCAAAGSNHYQDYSCPIDNYPNLYTDLSETGGAHTSNCVADFMETSWSSRGNRYGWSYYSDVPGSFVDYVNLVAPEYSPTATNYTYSSFSFNSLKYQIDNGRPVVFLVDSDGNGSTDHFVPIIGYDDVANEYACYNTWDASIHWYQYRAMSSSYSWGVYGATVFNVTVPTCADLTPSYYYLDGVQEIYPGESLQDRLHAAVGNIGNISADSSSVGFYISTNNIISTADQLLTGGLERVGTISASGSRAVVMNGSMTVPSGWPAGVAYLGIIVDRNYEISECDETNNTAFIPVTVYDIPEMSVSPGSYDQSLMTDEIATSNLTIYNDGDGPLEFYISQGGKGASIETKDFSNMTLPDLSLYDIEGKPIDKDLAEFNNDISSLDNSGIEISDINYTGGSKGIKAMLFSDDFEDGDYVGWFDAGFDCSKEVTGTTAANGTSYSYHEYNSYSGNATGIYQIFDAIEPTYISFYVRPGSTSEADGYFVLYDSDGSSQLIWFFASSSGYFYLNGTSDGGHESYSYTADTWYHIEFRNMDFSASTFDYYVNSALVMADIPFRHSGADDIGFLNIYNHTSGAEAWWDEIVFENDAPDWLSVSPSSGTVAAHSASSVTVTMDASGMAEGDYYNSLFVTGNDPFNPAISVPVHLEVDNSQPDISVSPSYLSEILSVGDTSTQSLFIYNNGDATLNYGILIDESKGDVFVVDKTEVPGFIGPDSDIEKAAFISSNVQSVCTTADDSQGDTDTPVFQSPVTQTQMSPSGGDKAGDLLSVAQLLGTIPDYSGNAHPMGVAFDGLYYWVVGGGYSSGGVAQLDDNFNLIDTQTVDLSCRSISYNPGDGEVYIKGYGENGLYRLNRSPFDGSIDTICTGLFQNSQSKICFSPDGQYMYDHYNGNVTRYDFPGCTSAGSVMLDIQHDMTYPRYVILAHSGDYLLTLAEDVVFAYDPSDGSFVDSCVLPVDSSYEFSMSYTNGMFFVTNYDEDTWQVLTIDGGAGPSWLTVMPTGGSVYVDDDQALAVHYDATGLASDTYYAYIVISSNDPDNPTVYVPVYLDVLLPPDIVVSPASFDEYLFEGETATRQLIIDNIGSGPLFYGMSIVYDPAKGDALSTIQERFEKNLLPPAEPTELMDISQDQLKYLNGEAVDNPSDITVGDSENGGDSKAAWNSLASLSYARGQHGMVAHPNGNIYVFGGYTADSVYTSLEIYNIVSGTWSTGTPMPFRDRGMATAIDNDGYIYSFNSLGYETGSLRYDPDSDTWDTIAIAPVEGLWEAAAVTGLDGRIYVFGGEGTGPSNPLNLVQIYDPASDRWSTGSPMPTPRFQHSAVRGPTGYIYVMGGRNSIGVLDVVEIYNPVSDSWSSAMPMPTARNSFAASLGADGRIYTIGGKDSYTNNYGPFFDDVEIFDPVSGIWAPGPSLDVARGEMEATSFDSGIYTCGGTDGTYYNIHEVYFTEGWLSVSPPGGYIYGAGSGFGIVDFDAAGLVLGDYYAEILVGSNDPDESIVSVPVHLIVGPPPDIAVMPDSLEESLPQEGSSSQMLTIYNWGDYDLIFSITDYPGSAATLPVPVPHVTPVENANLLGTRDLSQPIDIEPNTTLWTGYGRSADRSIDVLILHSADYIVDGIDSMAANLAEFPGIGTVDIYNAILGTPTTAELIPYDVVIMTTDQLYYDIDSASEHVAEYLDQGGSVIMTTFCWANQGNNTISGRLLTDYSPFQIGGSSLYSWGVMGSYIIGHPIFEEATNLRVFYRDYTSLSSGAGLLALYNDGIPLVAQKGRVVGINAALHGPDPIAYDLGWTGDGWRMLYNTVTYLISTSWLSYAPDLGTIGAGDYANISVNFDATGLPIGDYYAGMVVGSNDPDEPFVEVPVHLNVYETGSCVIDIAEVDGPQGLPVGVPVVACDVTDVAGIEFHIENDSLIVYADSVTSDYLTGATVGALGYRLNFIWEDFMNPVSFAEGDTIVTLWYTCVGTVGEVSPLTWFGNNEMVDDGGDPITGLSYAPGSVEIIMPYHDIAGHVYYYDMATMIPDVDVDIAPVTLPTEMTDGSGYYMFASLAPDTYTLEATRTDDDPGVSVADIIKIRRHLAMLEVFDTPYKLVAADVNLSGSVSVADIIKIRRYLAMLEDLLSGNWIFIDSAYAITESNWSTAPQIVDVSLAGADVTDASFVGVRKGDVNNTWSPVKVTKPVSAASAAIQVGDVYGTVGETISLPITVQKETELAGVELHFDYDASQLSFVKATSNLPGELTLNNTKGTVHLIWEDIDNVVSTSDNQTLVNLQFKVLPGLTNVTDIELTSAELVNLIGTPYSLEIENGRVTRGTAPTLPKEFSLEQNRPNPFNPITEISFSLPTASDVHLDIYNIMGQRVATLVDGFLEAGRHTCIWDAGQAASGVYFYRLQAGTFTAGRKMILLK